MTWCDVEKNLITIICVQHSDVLSCDSPENMILCSNANVNSNWNIFHLEIQSCCLDNF